MHEHALNEVLSQLRPLLGRYQPPTTAAAPHLNVSVQAFHIDDVAPR